MNLAYQCALFEVVEEVADVSVNLDAASGEEVFAGPAAGFYADGPDLSFAGGFGVVGGVPEGQDFVRLQAEALEGGLEDVGVGLGTFSVVGAAFLFDEVFHADDFFVDQEVFLAGGRCEREADAGFLEVNEELAGARDGFDPG